MEIQIIIKPSSEEASLEYILDPNGKWIKEKPPQDKITITINETK